VNETVLLDDAAFLKNGQIGDAHGQGLLANDQTELSCCHEIFRFIQLTRQQARDEF
jgi:hypothetical protein